MKTTDFGNPVEVALRVLRYCETIERPGALVSQGQVVMPAPRPLTVYEARLQDRACAVLLEFLGQVDFEALCAEDGHDDAGDTDG